MLVEKIRSLKNFNLILFAKGTYKGTQILFSQFFIFTKPKSKGNYNSWLSLFSSLTLISFCLQICYYGRESIPKLCFEK
jgi:hypothetical protein